MRIVEVDDSAWGDLVGGVFLCFNDLTSHNHVILEIPPQYFQGEKWLKKEYFLKSRELTVNALEKLEVKEGDNVEFHVCTGYINDAVAGFLAGKGFRVERCKIEGETQSLVESAYEDYLKRLTGLENIPPSSKRFFFLLKWVRADLKEREKFVKTGWRSWNERWRTLKAQKDYKACVNCKWLAYSGPHVGCFHGYEYHGWLPKRAIKANINCQWWQPK